MKYMNVFFVFLFGVALIHAQGDMYGEPETIFSSSDTSLFAIYSVRAYDDTVLICGVGSFFFSTNKGSSFDHILNSNAGRFEVSGPSIGTDVYWYRRREDGVNGLTFWRLRGGIQTPIDTVDYYDKNYPQASISPRFTYHPTNKHLSMVKFHIQTQFYEIEPTFIKRSDTDSLHEIPPPNPQGSSYVVTWAFDYARPTRLYVIANGSDFLDCCLSDEYFYTDDYGKTYYRAQYYNGNVNGIGILEKDWGIYSGHIKPGFSNTDVILKNVITGEFRETGFRQQIIDALFPGYDSTTNKLGLSWSWDPSLPNMHGIFCHPEIPNVFAINVSTDTLASDQSKALYGTAITTDKGKSWQWVIRPRPYGDGSHSTQYIVVDPKTLDVYYSYFDYDRNEKKRVGSGVVRLNRSISSGVPQPIVKTGEVFPQPVANTCTLPFPVDSRVLKHVVFNVFGQDVTDGVRLSESFNGLVADFSFVANGYYTVIISEARKTYSYSLIVQH